MSDPMTNTEVEDVLSSIRRLVSDDKRAGAPTTEPTHDRLVLTPSLRVSDEDPQEYTPRPEAAAEDAPEASAEPDKFDETAQDLDPDAPWGESVSAWAERENLLEPEPLEEAPEAAAELKTFAFRSVQTADAGQNTDADAPGEQAPVERIEPVDAVAENVHGSHDDALGDDFAAEMADDTDGAGKPSEPLEAPDDADPPLDGSEAITTDQTLSDKIAALETLIAGRPDQWEPDDAGTDAYAGTEALGMAWEDAKPNAPAQTPVPDQAPETAVVGGAPEPKPQPERTLYADPGLQPNPKLSSEPEVEQRPGREPELSAQVDPEWPVRATRQPDDGFEPEEDAGAALFSKDDAVLDEAALRELVADIVREELQGALGERITRNVRKLVRREIHRALAAQELD